MKFYIYSIATMVIGMSCASCQDKNAFKMTVIVTDDTGTSVPGIMIRTSVFESWKRKNEEGFGRDIFTKLEKLSDDKGVAVLEGETSRCDFLIKAEKPGYYPGRVSFESAVSKNGRWEPWNPTLSLELKRLINPIPLMAKKINNEYGQAVRLPADEVAYDLEEGDWSVPHGKGAHRDIVFRINGRETEQNVPYDAQFTISFSNPGDGLVVYEPPPKKGSMLVMPYRAPEDGYASNLAWRKTATVVSSPGGNLPTAVAETFDDSKPGQFYFLRVRTVLDGQGKVVSANYAKVQRGFVWWPSGAVGFQYCFNPTVNDTNLEFDPSRNLLKVKAGEGVSEP